MRKGIQTFLSNAGETSCYALIVIRIAELVTNKPIDIVRALEEGIARGFIYYNNIVMRDPNNFYMNDPASFLSYLTNKYVTCKKVGPEYYPGPNEYAVNCWGWKKNTHFNMEDFDTLVDSQTVKHGKIISKRIFTIG